MNESRIEKEWLYDSTEEAVMIFTRENEVKINKEYLDNNEDDFDRLEIHAEEILSVQTNLLLTELNIRKKIFSSNEGKAIIKDIINWFRYTLEVISPEDMASGYDLSYGEGEYLSKLSQFLQLNDTGIEQAIFEDTQGRIKDLPLEIKIKDRIKEDFNNISLEGNVEVIKMVDIYEHKIIFIILLLRMKN
ncbi:hypothetical protein ACTQ54_01165 [Fundicoccus sp. Sow4_H7]|uniref:hypothetical protein n=1 Tax=Fundicoccus sp. Sow4_H7 TaxID=3438784 RepID=UPI003F8E3EE2